MKIAYVGVKELKGDNIAATGLVWTRGQVHEVADDKKSALLIAHKLIWVNADGKSPEEIQAMLIQPLAEIQPDPRVTIAPIGDGSSPYSEPIVVQVTAEVFTKLQMKEIVPVFMSEADADLFSAWKKEQADPGPKQTGPKAKPRETKPGLDTREGLTAKKVA